MDICERLEDEAREKGIDIIDCDFQSENIKGLYCDGVIGISKHIKTTAERACVVAEELGHHNTSVGNILDMSVEWNRKQERQARFDGYRRLIQLMQLINAYEAGCQNRYEIADYLDVSEEYLQDCIDSYRDKYGIGVQVGEYYLMFIPYLGVMKTI